MKLNATQVYERLKSQDLTSFQGAIKFSFGGIDLNICKKDVVGNIIQEWLRRWFDKENIEYALNENTQMPPDFYLDPNNTEHDLLEVKAFNYDASPGFDIADFTMYAIEVREHPYMLYADYLIFGYVMDESGIITIKDFWLKKVWEITRRAPVNALFAQVKHKQIHKIRPAMWYRNDKSTYSTFNSIEEFVCAFEDTIQAYRGSLDDKVKAAQWLNLFKTNYMNYYHTELDIPRWDAIKKNYDLRLVRRKKKATEARDAAERNLKKIRERVSNWEKKLATARTANQKEKAMESLNRAKEAYKKARQKLDIKQSELDQLG